MTRFGIYTALVITTLMTLACGGGGTPPPTAVAPPPPPAPPPTTAQDRKFSILMTPNPHDDPFVTADCLAVVPYYKPPKMHWGQKATWAMKHDEEDCPDWSPRVPVNLIFKKAIWMDPREQPNTTTPTYAAVSTLTGTGAHIEGRVYVNTTDPTLNPPVGPYSYHVDFNGKPGSPDPEVDIDGDCCRPPLQ